MKTAMKTATRAATKTAAAQPARRTAAMRFCQGCECPVQLAWATCKFCGEDLEWTPPLDYDPKLRREAEALARKLRRQRIGTALMAGVAALGGAGLVFLT